VGINTARCNSAPSELFARDREWSRLDEFVTGRLEACLLALVYGRRRQGKTTLLQLLCAKYGGFYWQAEETEAAANLASLSTAYGIWARTPGIRFESWDSAIAHLLAQKPSPTPVVIDEVGRVIDKFPALPSIIQRHMAPVGPAATNNWTRAARHSTTAGTSAPCQRPCTPFEAKRGSPRFS
jgi:uncharacterized protein